MRKFVGRALVPVMLIATGLVVAIADEARDKGKWPAHVAGKYVHKTFRFRPAAVEYRMVPTRLPRVQVVFRINEKDIPADYFMAGVPGFSKGQAEEHVKKLLTVDDGHITVDAYWVNRATPKAEWKGIPELWVEGRALLGTLLTKLPAEAVRATRDGCQDCLHAQGSPFFRLLPQSARRRVTSAHLQASPHA